MMTVLVKWAVLSAAIFFVAEYLPGIEVANWKAAIFAALALGILNTLVRPVLWLLTLPVTILTLGLFSFVLNGMMFLLAARFVEGFSVSSLWWGIAGAFLVSLASTIVSKLLMGRDEKIG